MNSTGRLSTLTRTWQLSLRHGRGFFVLQSLFWHIGNAMSERILHRADWWTLTCSVFRVALSAQLCRVLMQCWEGCAVLCCVVLCCAEFIRCLFSVTCSGHDEALLCSHRSSSGSERLCDLLHVAVNVSVLSCLSSIFWRYSNSF